MRRRNPMGAWGLSLLVLGAGLVGGAQVASAQADEDVEALLIEIDVLSGTFPAFTPIEWDEKEAEAAFLYGDTKGIVHLMLSDGGRLREKWRSFPLEGTVRQVFGEDLDRDGRAEIIAQTSGARVYVWETHKFELLWESVEEKFEQIQTMEIADVDRDDPLEMVIVADNKILYYDGVEFFREKEGRDFVEPSAMIIADVDGDLTDEIVTNDGYVIDTNTLSIEWANDGFGYPISLFDLDNDGVLEVAGEIGGSLIFWDLEDRREIW